MNWNAKTKVLLSNCLNSGVCWSKLLSHCSATGTPAPDTPNVRQLFVAFHPTSGMAALLSPARKPPALQLPWFWMALARDEPFAPPTIHRSGTTSAHAACGASHGAATGGGEGDGGGGGGGRGGSGGGGGGGTGGGSGGGGDGGGRGGGRGGRGGGGGGTGGEGGGASTAITVT